MSRELATVDSYCEKVTKFKMASEEKSIKVIEFTGEDFKIWSKKFVACANRKGYKGLLEGTDLIPTKSEYEAAESESNDTQKKMRWRTRTFYFQSTVQ